mmetsp:Transcript_29927/g.63072  ORF Transcript_29927/g.63072 Transcript_29927/m.63072 type:complete len:227 (+) Transcript_29927:614-1294(+)
MWIRDRFACSASMGVRKFSLLPVPGPSPVDREPETRNDATKLLSMSDRVSFGAGVCAGVCVSCRTSSAARASSASGDRGGGGCTGECPIGESTRPPLLVQAVVRAKGACVAGVAAGSCESMVAGGSYGSTELISSSIIVPDRSFTGITGCAAASLSPETSEFLRCEIALRAKQPRFFKPGPPNLRLSRQFTHTPQSSDGLGKATVASAEQLACCCEALSAPGSEKV